MMNGGRAVRAGGSAILFIRHSAFIILHFSHGVRGIKCKSSRNTNAIRLMMNKKPA